MGQNSQIVTHLLVDVYVWTKFIHTALKQFFHNFFQITADSPLKSLFRLDIQQFEDCPIEGAYSFTYSRGHGLCEYPKSSLSQCSDKSKLVFRYQVMHGHSNIGSISNFGKAGSQLEIRHRGDYLSFVTIVESKPNHKFDESNLSSSTPDPILSRILSRIPGN